MEEVVKKYCNYCAVELTEKGAIKFCSSEHKDRFAHNKENDIAIPLRINAATLIMTKKYDKINDIIAKYRDKTLNINSGAKELIRHENPKGKVRKNTPEEPLF